MRVCASERSSRLLTGTGFANLGPGHLWLGRTSKRDPSRLELRSEHRQGGGVTCREVRPTPWLSSVRHRRCFSPASQRRRRGGCCPINNPVSPARPVGGRSRRHAKAQKGECRRGSPDVLGRTASAIEGRDGGALPHPRRSPAAVVPSGSSGIGAGTTWEATEVGATGPTTGSDHPSIRRKGGRHGVRTLSQEDHSWSGSRRFQPPHPRSRGRDVVTCPVRHLGRDL
jgi:hypothetical protein